LGVAALVGGGVVCVCAQAPQASQTPQAPQAPGNREFLLRFGLKPGQTFRYHGKIAGTGQMEMEGQSRPVAMTGEFDVVHRVEREKDGAFEVTTRFERDKVTIQVAGEQEQASRVGLPPLTRLMTTTGRIISEQGWEKVPEAADSALRVPVRWFSSHLAAAEFPDKPVKAGDAWADQVSAPAKAQEGQQAPFLALPGTGQARPIQQITTFEGIEAVGGRECARLRTRVTVPFDMWLPEDPIGTRVHAKGEQQIESSVLFDHARGAVLKQEASVHVKAETEAHLQGVKEPIRARCDLVAKVTLELANLEGRRKAGERAPSG
jgi:hypothetical protein